MAVTDGASLVPPGPRPGARMRPLCDTPTEPGVPASDALHVFYAFYVFYVFLYFSTHSPPVRRVQLVCACLCFLFIAWYTLCWC